MTSGEARQAGFSLVELLTAMVLTLIVSGAIYGLLTAGQNAFRREPEMTDRQQNIRIAMDALKRDVAGAGGEMVPFVQAFTNNLDGQGGAPTATQTAGSSGQATDILEVLTTSGQCRPATLSTLPPPGTGPLSSNEGLPSCFPNNAAANAFIYVGSDNAGERNNYGVVLGKANVPTGAPFQINLTNSGTANLNPTAPNPAAGFCATASCRIVVPIDVSRYRIAPDPADPGVPSLWRSRTGAFDSAGNAVPDPPGGNWEVVARGIEDLQVEYMNGGGAWSPTPGAVYCAAPCNTPADADLNRLVRRVRITISARAAGIKLQGSTTAGGGAGVAVRGQLVTEIAPRAALQALTLNPASAARWY